jgi:hypothetical protein
MKKIITALLIVGVSAIAAVAPAGAAQQSGLVNVNVEDNTVQVPVAVAANVCGITVVALVADLQDDGDATCTALAGSVAYAPRGGSGGGGTTQEGLINVNLEDNVVQVPVAAAANVCDVSVVLLATEVLLNDATECTAGAGAAGIA